MGTNIFLGKPPANVEQWIRKHHSKPETHIKFVDGTEDDYLLEGNVDWQYLAGKGLVEQAGGPPAWIKQPQEVNIGSAVTSIGGAAFFNCSQLTSIAIPDDVTTIEYAAFFGCSGLASISIPNNVASIGSQAFQGCSGLTSMTIPEIVASIGSQAFYDCNNLADVTFSGKDMATVQSMEPQNWYLPSGCVLHCTDGDITI